MPSFFLHAYEKFARTTSIVCLIPSVLLAAAPSAEAQDLYAFQDYGTLNSTMTKIAAETTDGVTISDPCNLHIISIDGASILFPPRMLAAMNKVLAQTIVGSERLGTCSVGLHELTHDALKVLIARERSRAVNAHIFQIIYIPIADKVVAYASFRDSTGQIVGKGRRFDLPVVKDQEVLTTAAFLPKPKIRTKLLTEVHFDSASVNITYVGNQKITKAIEAIKDQNPVEIRIFGFSDTLGDPISNKATSQARADNVARAIKEAGIDLPLVVEGRGEGVGPYQTPDGMSEPLNRCVGIIAVFHDPAE